MKCPNCESPSVISETVEDGFIYGSGDDSVNLTANVIFYKCNECDFSFTDDNAEIIRHEVVCKHLGVLTPKDTRIIRESYGISRSVFADITGIGEASIARWETGLLIQNQSMDRYLYLLKYEENFYRLIDKAKYNSMSKLLRSDEPSTAFKENRKFRALDSAQIQEYSGMSKHFSLRAIR